MPHDLNTRFKFVIVDNPSKQGHAQSMAVTSMLYVCPRQSLVAAWCSSLVLASAGGGGFTVKEILHAECIRWRLIMDKPTLAEAIGPCSPLNCRAWHSSVLF